ncbi:MAG TPA: hypothetical protein VMW95_01660 [Desulfobacterales bacterium]|nr:hypothetical protein [Desulfobacterales bacterium]
MSGVGAETKSAGGKKTEKHERLFNSFKSLQGAVSEMEDLLRRVRGTEPCLEVFPNAPQVKPNPDTLADVLNELPGLLGDEAERLVKIRTQLTEKLF